MPTVPIVPTVDEVVEVTASDGLPLNLVHPRREQPPTRGPVILVHGAGVNGNVFRPPTRRTLVDVLLDAGHDVWLANWRASIDLPPTDWTLDQAAVHDHPALVKAVLELTGRDSCQAVVHCQGSTSFMMSAAAGLVPEVTTVVANAVALHPVIPRWSRFKISRLAPPVSLVLDGIDPRWGDGAPRLVEAALVRVVQTFHHECDNAVCHMVSFTYGAGFPALWRHENLNSDTHAWVRTEFGRVPMTFFAQMARCVAAGTLVSVDGFAELPAVFGVEPPTTSTRFVFLRGLRNRCFLPESMRRTYAYFQEHQPGRHRQYALRDYSHLDVFMGRRAAVDVFPIIARELEESA
ncbi:esterase [Pseudofrankia asymbiotica]|uniref:Esterase n=1 Tax=Pseudofrankia asymbiotica TaxID=1834516 RepID=A0A1V2I442_9ACTN|nr:esterase [Pseudofrankia asymbiotica]